MSISSVLTYDNAEQMEAAYLVVQTTITPVEYGRYRSSVTRVEFDNLWMKQVGESGPRLKWSAQPPNRSFVKFLLEPKAQFVSSGKPVTFGSIVRHARAEDYFERSSGPLRWGTMSLPVEAMTAYGAALADADLTASHHPLIVRPPPQAMTRLLDTFAAVVSLAQRTPEILAQTEPARALEQTLIEALLTSFAHSEGGESRWSQQTRRTVMRRFARLLESEPDRSFYVPEICALIGVPERTLRLCCQEHLGMSPKQYLVSRRMQLVHRALEAAAPNSTSVSAVACNYGFWHFGRFSVYYRKLFGEPPSATLRRPPPLPSQVGGLPSSLTT